MEELIEFIDSNPNPRELKRALAVKMVLEGYTYEEISNIFNVSLGSISHWKSA